MALVNNISFQLTQTLTRINEGGISMDNYMLFLEEYFQQALSNADDPYLEADFFEEDVEDKPRVYKENYYLRDNLQNRYIKTVLAKKASQDRIVEFVGKFLDDHSAQLSTAGPIHIFMFGESEIKPIYEMFNVTPNMMIELYHHMIDEAFFGKISKFITGWVEKAPHKVLITSILIDALQNNYEDVVTCCEYMWAFTEYPILYRNFWRTGVKEDVMNYTVEHLGSRYKIKYPNIKNLQGLLKHDAHSSVANMTDRLKTGADHTYTDLMQRMRNQMKATFKNISNAYYANDLENASQHNKSSQFDDGSLADQEGHTTNIAQVVDKTISKFSTTDVNNALARVAADASQVDKDNLIGYLNQINSAKNNRIPKFIEDVITSYFNKNPTEISVDSSDFLNFGLALYRSIGTSKDPLYQEIKDILNFWIYDVINIKQFYQREGTWIAYTRAVFNYMILMIKYYN